MMQDPNLRLPSTFRFNESTFSNTHSRGRLNLTFNGITAQVKTKRKLSDKTTEYKQILHGVSGAFRQGKLCAILGPSGAGKTTLLDILCGVSRNVRIDGEIAINGLAVGPKEIKKLSALVYQDDLIFKTMTVREALEMSALLRIPGDIPAENRSERVEDILYLLNLKRVENTIVGDSYTRGVSGGERKRVAVGMELIANPPILFLDEPTTGLDTFAAFSVVRSLKELAMQGRAVICTLHQPSSDIFALLDHIVLMSEGNIVYFGPRASVVPYFTRLGFQYPDHANPADFLFMEVLNEKASLGLSSGDNIKAVDDGGNRAVYLRDLWLRSTLWQKMQASFGGTSTGFPFNINAYQTSKASVFVQFWFLYKRCWKQIKRDPFYATVNVVLAVLSGVFLGLLYVNSSGADKTLEERVRNITGVLYLIGIYSFCGPLVSTINTFLPELEIFFREYVAGYYTVTPYFWSKVISVAPFPVITNYLFMIVCYYIVGLKSEFSSLLLTATGYVACSLCGLSLGLWLACMSRNIGIITGLLFIIIEPLNILSGVYVTDIPGYLAWIRYVSPIYYAFSTAMKVQFSGDIPNCEGPPEVCSGENVLEVNDLNNGLSPGVNIALLFSIATFYIMGAYLSLCFRTWNTFRTRKV